jgi:predicted GNAT family acetyltransferase
VDQPSEIEATDVVDNTERSRFEVRTDEGIAVLTYRIEDDRLVLVHTGVPPELEGHGVGGSLVRAAINSAAQSGRTVVPNCPFARKWLEDHPDTAGAVTIDW